LLVAISTGMKKLIRKLLQALGLYEACGLLIARAKGLFRGIRISRDAEGNYRVGDSRGRVIVINKRHAIYVCDMVEFFEFYFGAVTADKRREVHYEKPDWHTLPGEDRPLYFTSYAESRATLDLYFDLVPLQAGDVVLDVGAYCGLTSLGFAAKVAPGGHVHAFEPDRENFAALEKNRAALGVSNLSMENAAVWKETGTLEFQSDGTPGSRVLSVSGRDDSVIRVRSVTLADYIAREKIRRIDLLKIDVEGAEAEILAASLPVLARFRPALIVELHPVHDEWTTEACVSLLEREKYRTRIVPQPGTICPLLVALPKTLG